MELVRGVQKHVIFHIQNYLDGIYFRRLMRSVFINNVSTWNAVYRITTERRLFKELRKWGNIAWWEQVSPYWNSRQNWQVMFSVVTKLINQDENCLKAICYIFILENLEIKYELIKNNSLRNRIWTKECVRF